MGLRAHGLMLAMMLLWVAGCGRSGGSGPGPERDGTSGAGSAEPLRIAAASDLQIAFFQLGNRFRARTGIATTPTFLSSGQLAQQIEQGAPYDMFLAANESFVRDLTERGLIRPGSIHPYARGSLVLAVYGELGEKVRSLADLTRSEVRKIALANPATAPYGKAGKQALERAGLYGLLEPKIVLAESVRQALLYAEKGDAEAALVSRAIAAVPGVRAIEVDPKLYDPIVQALGIVAATRRTADAESFVQFILGEEGQGILKMYEFQPAPTPTDRSPPKVELRARDGEGTK
jgi:molybdate transport system substrate-binding protein